MGEGGGFVYIIGRCVWSGLVCIRTLFPLPPLCCVAPGVNGGYERGKGKKGEVGGKGKGEGRKGEEGAGGEGWSQS